MQFIAICMSLSAVAMVVVVGARWGGVGDGGVPGAAVMAMLRLQ